MPDEPKKIAELLREIRSRLENEATELDDDTHRLLYSVLWELYDHGEVKNG